jgi:hypothetical protein
MAEVDDLLRTWVSRRKAPVQELVGGGTAEEVAQLLVAGVNRKDVGGEAIPQLGFSVGLWNGRKVEGESASLAVTCGLAANNPHLNNSVALSFPRAFTYEGKTELVDAVFDSAVRTFEPDWAWVGAHGLRDVQVGQPPVFGVLTFLSDRRFNVDTAAVERLSATLHRDALGFRVRAEAHTIRGILDGLRNAVGAV